MSAIRKTNGKKNTGGQKPVIKTYRYTGSDRSINTLREQAKRWSGGKVTWRIVPDDPRKYTLMGTPGNCDAFHAGVKQLCDERNISTKGKGRGDRRVSQPKPRGNGREFKSESQPKPKARGREDRRDSQPKPKARGREDRRDSQNPPKAKGREDRRDSQNPPKGKGREFRSESQPKPKANGGRDRSFSPPRSRQGRKETMEKSFSPPPRRRHGGCKGAREKSFSPPPRHFWGRKEEREKSFSPPRRRGMYSNPYAPQREGNPYAPQREGNPYAPQREGNPYAPQREVNPYAPHRGAGNFEVGALSENVESITITTVTYKFVSKPKHTNPHSDIGSDEWMKWELDWNSGYC